MKFRPLIGFVGVGVALLLAVGCTLGPDPERPVTAAEVSDTFVLAAGTDPQPLPEVTPWWQEFGDETTNELVEMALANNPDLQAAAARVLEAEAGLRRAGGAKWPQVGYGVGGTRQKMSFVLPGAGRREIFSTTYSYDLNVSWQADLFGRLKRTRQASWASLLAEEASREAVTHSVVGAVVRARVLVATAGWTSTASAIPAL
ncbi:MAG: TolC family protein [Acidobacteriota bacterium]